MEQIVKDIRSRNSSQKGNKVPPQATKEKMVVKFSNVTQDILNERRCCLYEYAI